MNISKILIYLGLFFSSFGSGILIRIYWRDSVQSAIHRDVKAFYDCMDATMHNCGLMETNDARAECVVSNRYACFNDR